MEKCFPWFFLDLDIYLFFFPLTEAMVFTSGTFHGEDQELIDLKHLFQHSKVFDSFKGSNRIVYFMRLLFWLMLHVL